MKIKNILLLGLFGLNLSAITTDEIKARVQEGIQTLSKLKEQRKSLKSDFTIHANAIPNDAACFKENVEGLVHNTELLGKIIHSVSMTFVAIESDCIRDHNILANSGTNSENSLLNGVLRNKSNSIEKQHDKIVALLGKHLNEEQIREMYCACINRFGDLYLEYRKSGSTPESDRTFEAMTQYCLESFPFAIACKNFDSLFEQQVALCKQMLNQIIINCNAYDAETAS